eukprot:Em0708g6a
MAIVVDVTGLLYKRITSCKQLHSSTQRRGLEEFFPKGEDIIEEAEKTGVVGNEERAIACLGGVCSITKAAKQGCRLELRFRPEDNLCKPAFAKPEKVTNLVFKIRKRRIQQSSDMNQPTAQPLFEYAVSVLGIVDTQFEFTGLADFQVLPPDLTAAMNSTMPSCFQISSGLTSL